MNLCMKTVDSVFAKGTWRCWEMSLGESASWDLTPSPKKGFAFWLQRVSISSSQLRGGQMGLWKSCLHLIGFETVLGARVGGQLDLDLE